MGDQYLQRLGVLEDIITRETITDFTYWSEAVYEAQLMHNQIYRKFHDKLKSISDDNILKRFLPIQIFKNYEIKTGIWKAEVVFRSSGTSGMMRSQHFIRDLSFYHRLTVRLFRQCYNITDRIAILALLPGYLERRDSSLVNMVHHFINSFGSIESGFFIHEYQRLYHQLISNRDNNVPTLLLGVTHALQDFAEKYPSIEFPELIIMETGGMKGKRPEVPREELHQQLKTFFSVPAIHSEYGMTELMSQAYSKGDGWYYPPDTMQIVISEISDPFSLEKVGKPGLINVIDLGNLYTCSFIRTDDIGVLNADGSFRVLGRADGSEPRGCNLML